MLAFITVIGSREHDQDGDSVIKVYTEYFPELCEKSHRRITKFIVIQYKQRVNMTNDNDTDKM